MVLLILLSVVAVALVVAVLAVLPRIAVVRVGHRRARRLRGRDGPPLLGVEVGALGRDQVLQLTAFEEQTLALGALVDEDAVALVLRHHVGALRAQELHGVRLPVTAVGP